MYERVHSKDTYPLRLHQFTTQQVGKGGKRTNVLHSTQNPVLSKHQNVHSKATY